MEFIGTFFLVLVAGLSGNPLAVGAVLTAMVYMGGHISGAQYNPAVTLAVWLKGAQSGRQSLAYAATQLMAGTLAACVYYAIVGQFMIVAPSPNTSFGSALLVEMLFTFALASVVLHVAVTKATAGNHYFGLAIGSVVAAGAFVAGPISGGAFNPAVGLGPLLSHAASLPQHGTQLALYIAGPLLGAVVAALVYRNTEKA